MIGFKNKRQSQQAPGDTAMSTTTRPTSLRRRALEWFHDRGEVCLASRIEGRPSPAMVTRLLNDGELIEECRSGPIYQYLTDYGRRRLYAASNGEA